MLVAVFWLRSALLVAVAFSVMYLPCATASPPSITTLVASFATYILTVALRLVPSVVVAVMVAVPLRVPACTTPSCVTVAIAMLLVFHVTVWPAVSRPVPSPL